MDNLITDAFDVFKIVWYYESLCDYCIKSCFALTRNITRNIEIKDYRWIFAHCESYNRFMIIVHKWNGLKRTLIYFFRICPIDFWVYLAVCRIHMETCKCCHMLVANFFIIPSTPKVPYTCSKHHVLDLVNTIGLI